MKRWIPLAVILLAMLGAIVLAHRQQVSTKPSAYPLLSAAADAQHEATRVPSRLDPLSDAEEIRIGNELADEYTARWPASAEQKTMEAYLQTVGERVAVRTRRKLPFRFHYIPDAGFVNAFALPGGHVFVGEGLLKLIRSEDALAAVLGQEAEHVDLRHCAERVQTEAHLRNLDILGPLGDLVALPVEIFVAGYSKEQETEADADGTTLAVQAGYSAEGILQLLKEFEKLEDRAGASPNSPVEEAAQLTTASLEGYFQSHPPAAERAEHIRSLARVNHWPSPKLTPLAPALKASAVLVDGRLSSG